MGREKVYRRDIDGLRAIAVLAITVHHAFPGWIPGGFVGVDVFFVISGFLITRIIVDHREAGVFSWGGFYLRRARRIVPAYVVVALSTAALALWIEMPRQLTQTGAALAASGLFGANILFAQSAGYFSPGPQENPFLHLWSLGVEEQFYLVWPLLIAALSLKRLKAARPWLALALLAASLVGAQAMVAGDQRVWAFFGSPPRAWEFLAGAALPLGLIRAPAGRGLANAAAILGLLLIVASLALLTDTSPFPGLLAVPACLGTLLVLWSGQSSEVAGAAILRLPPIVALGRISYSLYLWHWPLLVLAVDVAQGPLSLLQRTGLVALAGALAAATWFLVERPFRKGSAERPWRRLLTTLAPLVGVIGVGVLLFFTHGLPARLSAAAKAAAALEESDVNPLRESCFGDIKPLGCRIGAAPGAKDYDVLIWGDSHADAMAPGVVLWARRRGWSVREAAQGGCPPVIGVRVHMQNGVELGCPHASHQAMAEIAANPKLKLIVLSARWPMYRDAPPFYDVNSPRTTMTGEGARGKHPTLSKVLLDTVDAMAAANPHAAVLIIGPTPELTFTPPECLAQARHLGLLEDGCFTAPSRQILARLRPTEAEIREVLAKRPTVRAVFPGDDLCHGETCASALNSKLIYFDDDHLSASGARRLVPGWMDRSLGGAFLPEGLKAGSAVPRP